MNLRHPRWHGFVVCALLSFVTLAAFSPLLHSDFIKLDDREYVTENPHVLGGLTWEGAKWALRTGYASNWHPVTWLSHMGDVQLFGLKPGGHHLTNLLFHTANSILVFLILWRMTGAQWRSAMIAALFALHPLHVESAAWIAERKDVLSAFFFLLTIGAYCRYVESKNKNSKQKTAIYLLALFLFALGLMSKPMLVTLPMILLLLDWWPLRRFKLDHGRWKPGILLPLFWEKVPFLVLSVASSIVTVLVQEKSLSSMQNLPLNVRSSNAVVSYGRYLGKSFWPVDLAIFYPHPGIRGAASGPWPWWQIALAALVVAGVTVFALLWLRRNPWFAVGWFWYLGMLVPVIGIVQVGLQSLADRYTYLPLIGIFICLVWGFSELFGRWSFGRRLQAAAGLGVVAACVALTYQQAGFWHDNLAVFEHALAVTARNSVAHYNLGVEFASRQKFDLAIPQYRGALAINPDDANTCVGLGIALSATGKTAEAIEQYQAGLRLEPGNERAHNNLGVMLQALGKPDEAIEHYHQALHTNPEYAQPHFNLGYLLASSGHLEAAADEFATALRLKPDYAEAMTGSANVLMMRGNFPEAQARFEKLVRLYPADPTARLGLGEALKRQGKRDEALRQFAESLRLDPNQTLPRYNLGTLLFDQDKFSEAEIQFAEMVRRDSQDAEALIGLAKCQARQGKTRAAITSYEQAIKLRPGSAEALSELAWILATHQQAEVRNGSEAVRLAERACQVSGGRQVRPWAALDAAYAETGRFAEAIRTAEKARAMATAAGLTEAAQAATARLALYTNQKPFRE